MGAVIFGKVPHPDTASTITADDLALVRMNDYVIDRTAMSVAPLNGTTSSLPNLDCAIFRARDHPLSFTVKCYTGNIAGVALESQERVGIRRLDIVELYSMMTSSCEEALVRRDA